MNFKVITSNKGFKLLEYIIQCGLLNNGFDSKEELHKCFPDSTMKLHYINSDNVSKIYGIKNVKTNKLLNNKNLANPSHKYYEKQGSAKTALKNYEKTYESKLKKAKNKKDKDFLLSNPPKKLKVVTFYLVEDESNKS